jgi:hypothetical protein
MSSKSAINSIRQGVDSSKLGTGKGSCSQPLLTYSHKDRDAKHVSEWSMEVIQGAMAASGVTKVNVTSTYRSPTDQVRVMLGNYVPGKTMYRAFGRKVEAVATSQNYTNSDRGTKKGALVEAAMLQELERLEHVHGVGCVSHHQKDPSRTNVIDIAAASVTPQSKLHEFVRRLTISVFVERIGIPKNMKPYSHKHFHETAHCIHVEIPQLVVQVWGGVQA